MSAQDHSIMVYAPEWTSKVDNTNFINEDIYHSISYEMKGITCDRSFVRWMMRASAYIGHFLTDELQLNLKWFGLPKDPFGSIMITSLGGFHVEMVCSAIHHSLALSNTWIDTFLKAWHLVDHSTPVGSMWA
jgi:hypothetical protein